MVTMTPSRRERKKSETRERILSTGIEAFAKKGIDGVTMDEIALSADVGKGTIYNYVSTKEDIVIAFMTDIERDVQRAVANFAKRRGSLDSILTAFILYQFKLKEPHHAFVRVFLSQLCGRATTQSRWVLEINTAIDPPLIELFTALQQRGAMRRDIEMQTLIRAFKVMHLGLTVLWALTGPPWAGMDQAVRQQVRLFSAGLEMKR